MDKKEILMKHFESVLSDPDRTVFSAGLNELIRDINESSQLPARFAIRIVGSLIAGRAASDPMGAMLALLKGPQAYRADIADMLGIAVNFFLLGLEEGQKLNGTSSDIEELNKLFSKE